MRRLPRAAQLIRSGLIAVAIVAAPRAAFACPVCFGQSDSQMAIGTNMAIFFMLGLTGAVLTAFGAFIVYLMRRARLFSTEGPDDFGGFGPTGTGPYGPAGTGLYGPGGTSPYGPAEAGPYYVPGKRF